MVNMSSDEYTQEYIQGLEERLAFYEGDGNLQDMQQIIVATYNATDDILSILERLEKIFSNYNPVNKDTDVASARKELESVFDSFKRLQDLQKKHLPDPPF
jgi:hypothetical protein